MALTVTAIAGNPKPGSRTLEAARIVASRFVDDPAEVAEIDVITLGAGLLGWGDEGVKAAVERARASDLIVVASPTFKATYTGVLKLFLDQFETGTGLAGVTAIPLMLGAGPAHALAPDVFLKPVLVELGAVVPVQGLYLSDRTYAEPESLDPWIDRWGGALRASAERGAALRD
ncbi:NADPH-dependent FMN reductase [Microbacterium sp. 18062]|uniref:NADPH-dependent FMN reductase n=1 Tax=Microbacterium sp. 18062 TaxID=2681410 RepID=UPI00190F2492|nr:NAD(P)H-dependent oxidoreductase [Microbacterium sp. 18062]